jgi:hypothetical protein
MEAICETCAQQPLSHSFRKLKETEESILYYTNPSKAILYQDTEGILSHYRKELNRLGTKRWKWIFDSDGFDWKHAMEVRTGIGLAKLISQEFAESLEDITIINPSWYITGMMMVVWPFLKEDIKHKITVKDDRYYSVCEFV